MYFERKREKREMGISEAGGETAVRWRSGESKCKFRNGGFGQR